MQNKNLELLAPAGSYETFKAVLKAGADAVYVGGNHFGARAYANNFSEEELLQAIDDAHIHGKQLYLTVNTLFKEEELEKELYSYLLPYYKQGLDAVIVQDMGAFQFIHDHFPGMDIHTSTQMTICNRYGAEMMKNLGATRVVTAREMSFAEIKDISDHVDIEIESFVHGALCYCFSGQCLLSSMIGGRSGNRGRCAQPCRLPYEVFDSSRKKIGNVEPFVLSPKDLCTIEYIPQLAESGIFSFKIEGRMKQAEYAAGVVSIYRKYMDLYLERGKENFRVSKEDMQKLSDFGNRSGFTKGYYEKHNGKDMITFQKPNHAKGNEALQSYIKDTYCNQELKEKINGKLILSKDLPAKLEVSMENHRFSCEGDVVQAALKQPLSSEKIIENMKKTGNTPFEFDDFELTMTDEIFMPMKSLNQLRRDALEGLLEKELAERRREEPLSEAWRENDTQNPLVNKEASRCSYNQKDFQLSKESAGTNQTHLSVSIESRTQLSGVLKSSAVSDIYLDCTCYNRRNLLTDLKNDVQLIHSAGKTAYYVLPNVFRMNTSSFLAGIANDFAKTAVDGLVVKSYDSLSFAKQYFKDMALIFDQNLYSYNNRTIDFLTKQQPVRMTAPFELNKKELMNRNNETSEIVIYGYLPLMTSAQCVHANTGTCDQTPTVNYLKDRYGKFFPVKNNCMDCCNTIYNSTPLMLFGYEKDLKNAGFHAYRLAFTTESEEQIKEVLSIYENVFVSKKRLLQDVYQGEYTNGHYKRGVE